MNAASLNAGLAQGRNAGIDTLRVGTTFLVVLHHAAITYGAIGGWYYKETPTDGSVSSPRLVERAKEHQQHGSWGCFSCSRATTRRPHCKPMDLSATCATALQRLGIPLLVYGFVIGPATIALAQTARAESCMYTLLWLWRQGEFEKAPLWFAWALLIFAVTTVLWRTLGRRRNRADVERSFPSNAVLLAAALATGVSRPSSQAGRLVMSTPSDAHPKR